MGNGAGQSIPGAARNDSQCQMRQDVGPVLALQQSIDYLVEETVSADSHHAAPGVQAPGAQELDGKVGMLGYIQVVGHLGLIEHRRHVHVEDLTSVTGTGFGIQQHKHSTASLIHRRRHKDLLQRAMQLPAKGSVPTIRLPHVVLEGVERPEAQSEHRSLPVQLRPQAPLLQNIGKNVEKRADIAAIRRNIIPTIGAAFAWCGGRAMVIAGRRDGWRIGITGAARTGARHRQAPALLGPHAAGTHNVRYADMLLLNNATARRLPLQGESCGVKAHPKYVAALLALARVEGIAHVVALIRILRSRGRGPGTGRARAGGLIKRFAHFDWRFGCQAACFRSFVSRLLWIAYHPIIAAVLPSVAGANIPTGTKKLKILRT